MFEIYEVDSLIQGKRNTNLQKNIPEDGIMTIVVLIMDNNPILIGGFSQHVPLKIKQIGEGGAERVSEHSESVRSRDENSKNGKFWLNATTNRSHSGL